MRDHQLKAILHGLGIDDDTAGALLLLPLVQVAWADGTVQESERSLILDRAQERGLIDQESQRLLRTWLRHRPSERYLARGRMALVELAHRDREAGGQTLAPGAIDDVVDLCQEVARAAGGLFLGLGSVDKDEKAVLSDLAETLHVDREHNWQQLFGAMDASSTAKEDVELFDFDEDPPGEDDLDDDDGDGDEITQVGAVPVPDLLADLDADDDGEGDNGADDAAEQDQIMAAPGEAPPVRGPATARSGDDFLDDMPDPMGETMIDDLRPYDPGQDDPDAFLSEAALAAPVQPTSVAPPARVRVHTEGTSVDKDIVVELTTGSATVGRRPDNEVVLRWDHKASRTHCRIFSSGDRWYVVDSGSVNGTLVNGEFVLERRLFGNEQIEVGSSQLRFEVS